VHIGEEKQFFEIIFLLAASFAFLRLRFRWRFCVLVLNSLRASSLSPLPHRRCWTKTHTNDQLKINKFYHQTSSSTDEKDPSKAASLLGILHVRWIFVLFISFLCRALGLANEPCIGQKSLPNFDRRTPSISGEERTF
jgi:hypothetical protein